MKTTFFAFLLSSSLTFSHELDLGQLFNHYGSDKDINGYTSVYHTLFDSMKDKKIKLLEIGIGTMIPDAPSSMVGYAQPAYKPGGSLRAWRDYFKNGEIFGADIQPDTQFDDEPGITTFICNSLNKQSVQSFMKSIGNTKFDIIIDDGCHIDKSQLTTLSHFYPFLKDGGLYIIEDIYPGSSVSLNPGEVSKFCNGDPLFFVGVKNNMCIIFKKHLIRTSDKYNY